MNTEAEIERERCSKILRDAIDFVIAYPSKHKCHEGLHITLKTLKNTLTIIKEDIDQGKRPRSERISQDFGPDEMEQAERIMEGLK